MPSIFSLKAIGSDELKQHVENLKSMHKTFIVPDLSQLSDGCGTDY